MVFRFFDIVGTAAFDTVILAWALILTVPRPRLPLHTPQSDVSVPLPGLGRAGVPVYAFWELMFWIPSPSRLFFG